MLTPTVEKVIKQLKKADLSLEDRTALTTALLDKLHALPLRKTFIIEGNKITLNGKKLDQQQTINFKDGVQILKNNQAHKVFNEQLRYLAINLGINTAVTIDTLMFAKAALWVLEQETLLYESLQV